MTIDVPDGLSRTVICGLCSGETDDFIGGDGRTYVRCLSCDNEATIKEARDAVTQFIQDYQVNQVKTGARNVGDRLPWVKVDADPVPERAYRFVLKPAQR